MYMKQLTMTKVLTPLAALAFAFGVQAATISDGFETDTSTVVTNRTGWSFTYGTDGADDASAITAYGEAAKPASLPDAFATAGDNYLKLSTEDGMLFRELGAQGKSIGVEGLFVDTDVQFTITDPSDRPEVTGDDKFIIWLEDQGSQTNLCVWARQFTAADGSAFVSNVYTLAALNNDPVSIVPGTWHRLTVKALSSIGSSDFAFPAFQVYLDGALLKAKPVEGQYITTTNVDDFDMLVGTGIVTGQTYFPAMADTMDALSQIGFSGEGAIDNVSVTDDVPGNLPHHKLTISWDTAVLNAVTLKNANDVTVATITNSGDSVSVDATTVLHFAKTDLGFIDPTAADSYDFKDINDEAWAKANYATLELANDVVTIAAANGDGSFTIALDRNTAAVATITLPNNVATAIDSVTYTVNGSSTTINASSRNEDEDDTYFNLGEIPVNIEIGQTITISVTAKAGYSATIVGTAGVTGSAPTFTIGNNVATITISAIATAATVNGTPYETFADALAAAATAGTATITLAQNATVGDAEIAANKNITIDLAGNTITGTSGADAVFSVVADGTLTITNSTGTGYLLKGEATACISNAGTLNIQAGNFGGAISSGAYVTGGFFDTMPTSATCPADKVIGTAAVGETYAYGLVAAIAQIEGGDKYATLKDAIDAAQAGDTVIVLADCEVAEAITFNYGITVSNDYTVTLSAAYALRIFNGSSSDVTFCGSGTYLSTGTGSPVLVGNNEDKSSYNVDGTPSGRLVLASGTIKRNDGSNNMIKVENGKFVMNDGSLLGGSRGVKADADAGSFTSEVIINGGVITNGVTAAVAASRDSATGTATVTINGGDITGKLVKGANTTFTIPGTSTAKFDRDQSAFCESGYETTQSGDWYVVTAVQSSGWVADSSTITPGTTAATTYPDLASSALATADAKELTDWATTHTVAYADVVAAPANYVEAFLLNCALADVTTEKAAFKAKITVAADGTVTVTLDDTTKTYNGTLQLKGKANLTDAEWTDVAAPSSSYKFYKYTLSL